MKKNQNGVTLIALVITIVVMLILAGAAMASLSGDSGLMTNAQKAKASNNEAGYVETMQTAWNTLKTDVEMKKTRTGYQPCTKIADYIDELTTELGSTKVEVLTSLPTLTDNTGLTAGKYNIYVTNEGGTALIAEADYETTTKKEIHIVYYDETFSLEPEDNVNWATTDEDMYPQDNLYAKLEGVITCTTSNVTYTEPIKTTM